MMKAAFAVGFIAMLFLTAVTQASSGTGEKIVIEKGRTVKINFTLTVNGEVVDSTESRGAFEYIHGENQIIPGLEAKLRGLKVGDEREVVVGPEDGFGVIDPKAFVEVPKARLPQGDVEVGMQLEASGNDGRRFPVTVTEIKTDSVVLNFNHPLAGKELHFAVVVLEIS